VQDLCLSLHELVFLDLTSCVNITNNALNSIANNLKAQYLIFERCLSITDEGLAYIFKHEEPDAIMTSPSSFFNKKSSSVPKGQRRYLRKPST
jgi:hypothetical protein